MNGKTWHYCDKLHSVDRVPMQKLHKPEDHKESKDSKPKKLHEEKDNVELQDNLHSLISVNAKNFLRLETWPTNFYIIC